MVASAMFGPVFSKLTEMLASWRRDRRREYREDVDLGTVGFRGRTYPVKNWSSTGFLAAPCQCPCREGDSVDIQFHVEVPGKTVRFECKAILVRVDNKRGEVAGVFTMMEPETRIMVAKHFD